MVAARVHRCQCTCDLWWLLPIPAPMSIVLSSMLVSFDKNRMFFKWAIPGLFFFIFIFSKQLTENVQCKIHIAYGWIQTADLWNWKQPLYQLSHIHCPKNRMLDKMVLFMKWSNNDSFFVQFLDV